MTPTPITAEQIEDRRQALFGYRRDEHGEIIEASPMWDPGSLEMKQAMERTRLTMFGYCRNLQGKICTFEEVVQQLQGRGAAVDGLSSGTDIPQPSQLPKSLIDDLSGLQEQADRLTHLIRGQGVSNVDEAHTALVMKVKKLLEEEGGFKMGPELARKLEQMMQEELSQRKGE